jgi:Fur family transcriptional regulator, peroxide stress response regulator
MAPLTRMQQFEAACRAHGLPVTVQRRRIFEALSDRTDHPTPDQVYAAVKDALPGVSRTTVYRVLETLVRVGVLAKASSPSAAGRVDPRTSRHHHLVCQRCDRLFDVDDGAVPHRLHPPDVRGQGFTIADYSIYFTGLCASCQKQAAAARPARKGAGPKTRTDPRPRRRAGGARTERSDLWPTPRRN